MMSIDTVDARCKSIHAEKYLQVFGNKELFVEAYAIKLKADFHLLFVREYSAMERLIDDGSPE